MHDLNAIRRSHLACAIALATFCSAAQAADSSESITLDTMVVTAAATEQSLRDAPASITVLTEEDIKRTPATDLADLLGRVAGVTLQRAGNTVPGVQIRGFDQAYTLILIDGRRVNSTSASFRGNDYDTGWVPVDMIERIEVVRGPMSSLYGSDAIGGVVNIITKKATDSWHGSLSTTYIAQEQEDAGDTSKYAASLSGPLSEQLLVKLYGASDRRAADADDINDSGRAGTPYRKNTSANGELTWLINDNHDLSLNLDTSRRNHDDFVLRRDAAALTHHGYYSFGDSQVSLQFDETRNLDGTVSGQKNPNKANTWTAQGHINLPIGDSRLSLGGEWKQEELEDAANLSGAPGSATYGQDPTTEVETQAAFVEYEMPLFDSLSLTLGNRFDHHENFGGHNSPRAYLVWHSTDHLSFKGGWAKAFRAPTLLQNSDNWGSVSCGSATDGCYIVGSSELEPETSTSRELAMLLSYDSWDASLTVFRNDLKDMIDIDSRTRDPVLAPTYPNFVGFLPDGRPIFAYQNIDKVRTQGVEASLNMQLGSTLRAQFNYSYLDAENLSAGAPRDMTYKPEHSANATLDWDATERLALNVSARYTGTQYISVSTSGNTAKEAYTIYDMGGRYRVGEGLTLGAGVLNLFDEQIENDDWSDFNEDRRQVYASIEYQF
ncbi:TonB-dependent receptor domain-containing protein [Halopseudomonas pachastrellae]|uniref:TonB-dependent receptor domain-containing protein n=1 Tax=Halopseudomonas pachastrellae TaxID=254161 RepID=UPI003D7E1BEC